MTLEELVLNPNTECACGCGMKADDVLNGFADTIEYNVMDLRGEPFAMSCASLKVGVSLTQSLTEWGIRVRKRKAEMFASLVAAAQIATEPKKFETGAKTMDELTSDEKQLVTVLRTLVSIVAADSVYKRGEAMTSAALSVGRATGRGTDTDERIVAVIASCIAQLRTLLDTNFPSHDHDAAIALALEEVRNERTKAWLEQQKATAA